MTTRPASSRIPESMRASSQRQGSAWQAWADLRDSGAAVDQFLGSQSGRPARADAAKLAGAEHAAIHEILHQGRDAQ